MWAMSAVRSAGASAGHSAAGANRVQRGPAEYEDYSDDYSDDSDDESTEEEDWADGGPDPDFANREVYLTVYDLNQDFIEVNEFMERNLGMGAFHLGVIVYDCEYSYGCDEGVYGNWELCHNEVHKFREIIHLGPTPLRSDQVDQVLLELEEKWLVHEYHVLNRNCCDFAVAFVKELQCPHTVPSHYLTLAKRVARGIEHVEEAGLQVSEWMTKQILRGLQSHNLVDPPSPTSRSAQNPHVRSQPPPLAADRALHRTESIAERAWLRGQESVVAHQHARAHGPPARAHAPPASPAVVPQHARAGWGKRRRAVPALPSAPPADLGLPRAVSVPSPGGTVTPPPEALQAERTGRARKKRVPCVLPGDGDISPPSPNVQVHLHRNDHLPLARQSTPDPSWDLESLSQLASGLQSHFPFLRRLSS